MAALFQKLVAGLPYLEKELRIAVSERTPFMIARPRSVQVTPSERCNAFCPMCPIGEANRRGLPPNPQDLSAAQVAELLQGVKALSGAGVVVSFANGEPTIWKPLWDALEQGRALGLAVSFTTNGYTITQAVARRVAAINPFNVGVSLESLRPEVNEAMRPLDGKGTRKTLDAIEALLAARAEAGADFSINIKTVIAGRNLDSLPEIVERFADRPGVMWTPQPYRGTDPAMWVDDLDALTRVVDRLIALKARGYAINASDQNLRDIIPYFAAGMAAVDNAPNRAGQETLKAPRCQIGLTSLFVTQDGAVALCPYMEPVGRLGDGQTLAQMWTGPAAQERRKAIAACKVDCELSCTRRTSLWTKAWMFLKRDMASQGLSKP